MKRVVLVIILAAIAIGGAVVYRHRHPGEAKAGESKPGGPGTTEAKLAEEKAAEEETRIKHDEKGRVVVVMDDETQGNIGLLVAKPTAGQITPELKGYGRVLDPAALAALVTEWASAQAAAAASSNEFARLKTLAPQGNASERALQTAEAAARRDQLASQSARDRLAWSWSKGVADQADLPGFVQSLNAHQTALVRIDLPAGETLKTPPLGVRVATLSGGSGEAEYLGAASSVDPQTLGRGTIFLLKTNALELLAGEPLTGYLKLPGEPLAGAVVPHAAVVRAEGGGWVYVLNSGGASFTRLPVALDHPVEAGWFLTEGVTTNDYVVVTGAQVLLSEELKASIKSD